MTTQSEAWLKGRRAGMAGEPHDKNPYRGGQVYQSWFSGWQEGMAERQRRDQEDA